MTPPRLLVVDDDDVSRSLVSNILAAKGYHVDCACGGDDALKQISGQRYQLAVLDYQMPGLNGVELFEEIRKSQPTLIGVFLTAYADINTVYPAIAAGAQRVLAKPVDARELLPLVESLVGLPT